MRVDFIVNGSPESVDVEPRTSLADALRDQIGLTGTHLGCEHGVCGACTIIVDDQPLRACLMLAVQAGGADVRTIEGLEADDGSLHPIQQAFSDCHGLQCGFCTPGMVMTVVDLLARNSTPSREEIRTEMSANLCRCTGYNAIVDAVEQAARERS